MVSCDSEISFFVKTDTHLVEYDHEVTSLTKLPQLTLRVSRHRHLTPKVITGYCVITLRSVFGYSITVRYSLSYVRIL